MYGPKFWQLTCNKYPELKLNGYIHNMAGKRTFMAQTKPTGKNFPGAHSCGDCALRCIDCKEQICPKCFVQCAVGNRCKKCSSRFTSHVLLISPQILLRTVAFTCVIGFAYGYVEPVIGDFSFGYYGILLKLVLFYFVGKLVQRVASYKMGAKIITAVVLGLLLGLALGPVREDVTNMILTLQALPGSEDEARAGIKHELTNQAIGALVLIGGILIPFWRK